MQGEFAAIPGCLDTAERQTRITFDHTIYECAATLQLPGHVFATLTVTGPYAASQAKATAIGNRKRILSLPHTLAVMKIRGARHQDNVLHVEFAPARSTW